MPHEVHLLGEVRVSGGGQSYEPPLDRRLGLLGYLACQSGEWVPREKVAFLFWPDISDDRARTNLRSLLARCRELPFATELESDATRLRWPVDCDVKALREALGKGAWADVIDLYRGDLFGEATFDGVSEFSAWLKAERDELKQAYRSAVFRWAGDRHEAGATHESVQRLEELIERDPADEEAVQLAMTMLLATGRGDEASRLYRSFEKSLGLKLDAEPSDETRHLAEMAATQARDAVVDTTKRAGAARARPPQPLTSFIGRAQEVAEVTALLVKPDRRLVSIVGAGGVGKTRLALKVAEVVRDDYEDGVVFVGLEGVFDPERVPQEVVKALGLGLLGHSDATGRLVDALLDKRLLLVIDNFEQVIGAVAFLDELLAGCPQVDVLVTTRARLGSRAEWLFTLKGLEFPDADASLDRAEATDAVRLFVERASQVKPGFRLEEGLLDDVLRVCRIADGLPLALELAAVWLRVLSPGEVVSEIERNLGLLTDDVQAGPERHRSIRAAFEHSWSLLSEREQEVVRRLAPFKGGFRREGAAAVAGATIPVLAALVDKSLLSVDETGRYHRHPLMQQFASEKLALDLVEEREALSRHAEYFAGFLAEFDESWGTPEEKTCVQRISTEYDNICVAMESAEASGQADLGLRLMTSINGYWAWRGLVKEPKAWIDRLIAIPGADDSPSAGAAYFGAGWKSMLLGDWRVGRELLERALAMAKEAGDVRAEDRATTGQFAIAMMCGDFEAAAAYNGELFRIARQLDDDGLLMGAYHNLGLINFYFERLEAALVAYEECVRLDEKDGERSIPTALCRLAIVLAAMGEPGRTDGLLVAGLAGARKKGNVSAITVAAFLDGLYRGDHGDERLAWSRFGEALGLVANNGGLLSQVLPLHEMANLEASVGEHEAATRLWGAVDGTMAAHELPLPLFHRSRRESREPQVRAAMGGEAFEVALRQGRSMGLARAVEFALARTRARSEPR
ncbi:MAG TPA: BTAD domain-containing putative transcriptional regulator [Trueperaceae bacterium]|nr:BTAD domain-containing putative transcriptional regulator [Trueperaceae bacterium]